MQTLHNEHVKAARHAITALGIATMVAPVDEAATADKASARAGETAAASTRTVGDGDSQCVQCQAIIGRGLGCGGDQ